MSAEMTVARDGRDFVHLISNITHNHDDYRTQVLFKFTNGWAASVIRGQYTAGGSEGFFEMAVFGPDGELNYRNPITLWDVAGWLTNVKVVDKLRRLANFTSDQLAVYEAFKKWESGMREVAELKDQIVSLYAEQTGIVYSDDVDTPSELSAVFTSLDNLILSLRPETPEIEEVYDA